MELKDFVRDTLLDIVQGVKEAQDVCSAEGAMISPRDAGQQGCRVNVKGKLHHVQIVEFEAMLGQESKEESNMSGKGKIAVLLSNIGIGGELSNKQEDKNRAMTSIRFSVPVILPSIDNEEFEIRKVAHSR